MNRRVFLLMVGTLFQALQTSSLEAILGAPSSLRVPQNATPSEGPSSPIQQRIIKVEQDYSSPVNVSALRRALKRRKRRELLRIRMAAITAALGDGESCSEQHNASRNALMDSPPADLSVWKEKRE